MKSVAIEPTFFEGNIDTYYLVLHKAPPEIRVAVKDRTYRHDDFDFILGEAPGVVDMIIEMIYVAMDEADE